MIYLGVYWVALKQKEIQCASMKTFSLKTFSQAKA